MKGIRSGMFTVLACATAVSLSAQTTPPSGAPSQPSASAPNKIAVTGCLERAKETGSPTGTSGAAADSTKFVLNNVTPAASATGTSGSAQAPASSYRLDAADSKLTPHVGHKVEISGTVEPMSAASATGAPKLRVDALKMIAPSCTP